MKHNFNSLAVRNEVATMQQSEVKTSSKINNTALIFVAYLVAAVGVLVALNSLGLIPKD